MLLISSYGLNPRFISLPQTGDRIALVYEHHNTLVSDPIKVTPLKYSHALKTSQSWQDAFQDDPLERYIRDTPDSKHRNRGPHLRKLEILVQVVVIAGFIRHATQITNTVDKGSSAVFGSYAANSPEGKKRASDVILEKALEKFLAALQKVSDTPQRTERRAELNTKIGAVMQAKIGEKAKDMLNVNVLFTSPEAQGRGYASALVRSITSIADAQQRSTWLASSNIANTGFYNSQGFQTVGYISLGEADRDWKEPPIIVNIMVREPEEAQEFNDKAAILV